MAIDISQGFRVTSDQPVDTRLVMTKAEMAAVRGSRMPTVYMCMCLDDGKMYFYDKDAEAGETGKFKVMDETIAEAMESGEIEMPIASETQSGTVVSSASDKNKIAVAADGTMEVNSLGVEKLSNTENVRLVLNGGSASSVI